MRFAVSIAIMWLFAGSAFAQEAVKVEGALADAVKALPAGQALNAAHARSLNSAAMGDGLDPVERELFVKLASGQPFTASAGGSQLTLSADADAQRIAGMLTGVIDIAGMWNSPERMGDFVEMSRWAPVTWDATTKLAAQHFYQVRQLSNQANTYTPFRTLLDKKWEAIKALPDPDAREAGRAMLFKAVELMQEQNKKTYIELPGFVYLWLNSDETKASIK